MISILTLHISLLVCFSILELAPSKSILGDFREKLDAFMSSTKAQESPNALSFYADWHIDHCTTDDAQQKAKQVGAGGAPTYAIHRPLLKYIMLRRY